MKKTFLYRDRLLRAITADGSCRIAVVKSTGLARQAQRSHRLALLSSVLLGRALTGAALLASTLKGQERIQLVFEGRGPVGLVVAEASCNGEVRGYVRNPLASIDQEKGEVLGDGILPGLLSVSKTLYNKAKPVVGSVELIGGNISEDLAHYLFQSEQIHSAVQLDVMLDEKGEVAEAGGVLVQALPGASEDIAGLIEENIRNMPPVHELIGNGYIEKLLGAVTRGLEIKELDRYPVDFFCRCSRLRFKKALALLRPEELMTMKKEQEELVCHYCGKRYLFSRKEIDTMVRKSQVSRN